MLWPWLYDAESISPQQLPATVALWELATGASFTDTGGTTPAVPGDLVARLDDPIGGYNLVQATGGAMPTYGAINGRPALVFDAAPRWMSADTLAALYTGSSPAFSLAVVLRVTSFAVQRNIFTLGRGASGNPFHLFQTNASGFLQQSRRNDTSTNKAYNAGEKIGAGQVVAVVFRTDGSIGDTWLNGRLIGGGDLATNPATLDRATLGAQRLNTVTLGFLGEIGVAAILSQPPPPQIIRGFARWAQGAFGS